MCTSRAEAGAVPGALRPWVAEIGVAPGVSGGPGASGTSDKADTSLTSDTWGALGSPTEGEGTLTHLPDIATELVFHADAEGRGELVVLGPRTRAAYFAGKYRTLIVRLRLRHGRAEPVLGVPSHALTDRAVRLGELWGAGGSRLAERLSELGPDPAAVLRHMTEELVRGPARHVVTSDRTLARDALLREAARALASGPVRVGEVARDLHLSERRLHTLFTQTLGVSPKRFARIQRVRNVLGVGRTVAGGTRARARTHGASEGSDAYGARLALAAGYYDQSHMAAEFRALIGVPPGAFLAGERPTARRCGADGGQAGAGAVR